MRVSKLWQKCNLWEDCLFKAKDCYCEWLKVWTNTINLHLQASDPQQSGLSSEDVQEPMNTREHCAFPAHLTEWHNPIFTRPWCGMHLIITRRCYIRIPLCEHHSIMKCWNSATLPSWKYQHVDFCSLVRIRCGEEGKVCHLGNSHMVYSMSWKRRFS